MITEVTFIIICCIEMQAIAMVAFFSYLITVHLKLQKGAHFMLCIMCMWSNVILVIYLQQHFSSGGLWDKSVWWSIFPGHGGPPVSDFFFQQIFKSLHLSSKYERICWTLILQDAYVNLDILLERKWPSIFIFVEECSGK